ncbi:hypothetical protein [Marinitenerispora sediminis]|uniref:SPOR domain-containing protein n=1 Tax=Marinitenerispora sediminis TaxID=1931232 RepID=A0A368T688_9ACTN|nr:hypothetical protein [Marinitenerispora sediminis]RCV55351.1 hypothetical protein DEF28_06080 [Marinitenerispora sediminis]RCV59142.1 hypothetical protein DEF23_07675 [Marinitenerispora sediminis]RCV59168.1 hypothetical protein DEF24_10650 [Marinitenerispora sediminis]
MRDRDELPDGDHQWWFCLRHNRPEYGPGCPNKYRLGPYPDEAAAGDALATVARRNEQWDEEDERD